MKIRSIRTTFLILTCLTVTLSYARQCSEQPLNFLRDFGAVPFDETDEACSFNTKLLSRVLRENASDHTLWFPPDFTFHFHHGVYAMGVNNTCLVIDGTLRFEKSDEDIDHEQIKPFPSCFMIDKSENVTITSNTRGLIDGRGPHWWGVPMVGYIEIGEHRPRLLRFNQTTNLLIENIILQDAPIKSLYLDSVSNVEVRNISIIARRTDKDAHSWIDLSAFNTDGIDVSGHNVHIHDCDIWVQDDCIAVKDSHVDALSTNMLFERINATGFGLVIGSIEGSTVRNITFRDSYLHRSVKGIYLKFANRDDWFVERNLTGLIQDVLYENIQMEEPLQWPIWIGPAQQADDKNPCHANPCSLCYPQDPMARCRVVPKSHFEGITLRNVRINNPKMSPGVILGSRWNPMVNILFENVVVTEGPPLPIATNDRSETFPGTTQPIHDPYVPPLIPSYSIYVRYPVLIVERFLFLIRRQGFRFMPALGCLSAVVVSIILFRHGVERNFRRRQSVLLSCSAFILFLLSLFLLSGSAPYSWPWKPKWEQTDRYYKCQGVNNGTATGSTLPVPYCFKKIKSV